MMAMSKLAGKTAMAIGKFFKSLLGGAAGNAQPQPSEAVDYKGLSIEAAPILEDDKFRTAGFISGEVDGEVRRVRFIRADQHGDQNSAVDHSIAKARQIIDEQGPSLLKKTHL
jgi:hypothetical protein